MDENILKKEIESLRELAIRHIKNLSKSYPDIQSATTEIINLEAILNLPKGTEHFLSDIHGEHEAFLHVLKNASGVIRRKINDVFESKLSEEDKKILATIIYYPKEKLKLIKKNKKVNYELFQKKTIYDLVKVCRAVSSKYTRLKVREVLPENYAYIIEELLSIQETGHKEEYYQKIIETIVSLNRGEDFIENISRVIKRLAVKRLHIIGDIYDRGPGAEIIMDRLMKHKFLDIQWGNHDILWMAAASGHEASIANVIRISLRYANLKTLENGYGINLMPLSTFASKYYDNDECKNFRPKNSQKYDEDEIKLISKMHKAVTIIQFKLESEIIKRQKSFKMEERLLIEKTDFNNLTIKLNDKTYKLNDQNFPTINIKSPSKLTKAEKILMKKLKESFLSNEKLQKHIKYLYLKGSMYLTYNNNLMFHGEIPLNEDGSLKTVKINNIALKGKKLMDYFDKMCRIAYFEQENIKLKQKAQDLMWYLWCGKDSPLFGKSKMATFERYFINDKETHKEGKNPYFKFRENEYTVNTILREFGLDENKSRIINGHVPVKVKKGEHPLKANKKLIVIDGGFSKAYQSVTGIAGYTLIYNSWGLLLASHEPFTSVKDAIKNETDIRSSIILLDKVEKRTKIKDTDQGKEISALIHDLKKLVKFYKNGLIKENEV